MKEIKMHIGCKQSNQGATGFQFGEFTLPNLEHVPSSIF